MTITLHHYDYWPQSMAVRIGCQEAQVQPTIAVTLPSSDPALSPPKLIDTVSWNQQPYEVWGGLGGLGYIQERAPGIDYIPPVPCLVPLTLKWTGWGSRVLVPAVQTLLMEGLVNFPGNPSAFDRAWNAAKDAVSFLEPQVPDKGKFLNFEASHQAHSAGVYSMADLTVGVALSYLRILDPSDQFFTSSAFPRVFDYLAPLEQRAPWTQFLGPLTLTPNPPELIKRP